MIPAISLIQRGHMPPPDPPPAPGLFSMADPGRVKGLLRDAGFAQAQVEEVPLTFPVPNADGYLEFMGDTAASASRRSSRPPANTFVVTRRAVNTDGGAERGWREQRHCLTWLPLRVDAIAGVGSVRVNAAAIVWKRFGSGKPQ